jgi:RNA polymerase sigma factor (TIGR02999 family)
MEENRPVTALLHAWRSGQEQALEPLMAHVYGELRRLARRRLRAERPDHTLQPTELVHEAFLRLVGADVDWQDRAHFLAVAASTMRRILVDHARSRGADKRGGGEPAEPLTERIPSPQLPSDLAALDDAMRALAEIDPRKGRLVELYFFGGLTFEELGCVLGVSRATAHRELALARAWLHRELKRAPRPA